MSGLKKFHVRLGKHKSVDPGYLDTSKSNPFDSGDEADSRQALKPSQRTVSDPSLAVADLGANPFDDELQRENLFSSDPIKSSARSRYKNDFRDSGGVDNQSVQELESYAVYKSEETTKSVHGCLKIAEDIRSDATKTLVMLHEQGEQITRTHQTAADIDRDLSRGEKLLGSLGGMFSKTWKPKKTRPITGPVLFRDGSPKRRADHLDQREKLGLKSAANKGESKARKPHPEPTDAYQKIEVEKAKQDDGLSDLSDLLGELKLMAVDMGSEIGRQNKALDHVQDDVDVLNDRVDQANLRGRRLLRK